MDLNAVAEAAFDRRNSFVQLSTAPYTNNNTPALDHHHPTTNDDTPQLSNPTPHHHTQHNQVAYNLNDGTTTLYEEQEQRNAAAAAAAAAPVELEAAVFLGTVKQIDSRCALSGKGTNANDYSSSPPSSLKMIPPPNRKKVIVYYAFEITSSSSLAGDDHLDHLDDLGDDTWCVFRRYSDFTRLMAELNVSTKDHKLIRYPPLPKKNAWSLLKGSTNRSPQRIDARRRQLNEWLTAVIIHCLRYRHDIPHAAQMAVVRFVTQDRNVVPSVLSPADVQKHLPHLSVQMRGGGGSPAGARDGRNEEFNEEFNEDRDDEGRNGGRNEEALDEEGHQLHVGQAP